MLLMKRKSNPAEVVTEIAILIEKRVLEIYDDTRTLARTVNPHVADTRIGLNLITSLYALAMFIAHDRFGRSKNYGTFYVLMETSLEILLEQHGARDPRGVAEIALEMQTKMYIGCTLAGTNPMWEIGKAFIYVTSDSTMPTGLDQVLNGVSILGPFMSDVGDIIRGRNI